VTARPSRPRLVTILWAAFGALALATATGLALLWPDARPLDAALLAGQLNTEEAEVLEVRSYRCVAGRPQVCRRAAVALESGPDAGGAPRSTSRAASSSIRETMSSRSWWWPSRAGGACGRSRGWR